MATTMTVKGQVTIPKKLREALRLSPGDDVDFAVNRDGQVVVQYRRAGGRKGNVPADFFIGAHAAVLRCGILTRDDRRYKSCFPRVALVTPAGRTAS